MKQNKIDSQRHKIVRTAIMLLPITTLINSQIYRSLCNLLITTLLLFTSYAAHRWIMLRGTKWQETRKYIGCLTMSLLVCALLSQVQEIVLLYNIDYEEGVLFLTKIVVTLANLEGNFDLINDQKHENYLQNNQLQTETY